MSHIISFLDFIDRRTVVRRAVLGFTLFLTYRAMGDAWEFANMALANHADGVGVGAIIAAVMVPLAAIQKFAFSLYDSARSQSTDGVLK